MARNGRIRRSYTSLGDEIKEVRIDLILALCKSDKLEWVLEKTTEIGVANIYLLNAERSVVKLPADRLQGRIDRWQKIMNAASKQSRRLTLPLLHPPCHTEDLLPGVNTDLKLMLSEESKPRQLKICSGNELGYLPALGSAQKGVGPHEKKAFSLEAGFLLANMGHNILRSETAAIVATAILSK